MSFTNYFCVCGDSCIFCLFSSVNMINFKYCCCCSVTKSCSTLQPCGLQHTRLPCPSVSSGVCSNSCPLSQWCHLAILSPAAPFFSYLQSFPASGSFWMSWLFASGRQIIGASASALVLSVNSHGWFSLELTGLISLQSKGLSSIFSSTTVWKHHSLVLSFLYGPTLALIHDYWKKPQLWLYRPLLPKWCLWFLICCLGLS